MEDRTAPAMTGIAKTVFRDVPDEKRQTCTNDSGPEFAEHETMERELQMTMYFAHPYHSWERGTSENTNRLLRQFFPKGTHFAEIEGWELAMVMLTAKELYWVRVTHFLFFLRRLLKKNSSKERGVCDEKSVKYTRLPKSLGELDESYRAMLRELAKQ